MFVESNNCREIYKNNFLNNKELPKGNKSERLVYLTLQLFDNPKGNSAYKNIYDMSNVKNFVTDNANSGDVTINQFETQLAYWLDSFDGHLEFIPNAQQLLHDSLLSLDEQIYTDKEKKTVKAFLNSALSLTFLLKDNPTDLQKFINYKTQN